MMYFVLAHLIISFDNVQKVMKSLTYSKTINGHVHIELKYHYYFYSIIVWYNQLTMMYSIKNVFPK